MDPNRRHAGASSGGDPSRRRGEPSSGVDPNRSRAVPRSSPGNSAGVPSRRSCDNSAEYSSRRRVDARRDEVPSSSRPSSAEVPSAYRKPFLLRTALPVRSLRVRRLAVPAPTSPRSLQLRCSRPIARIVELPLQHSSNRISRDQIARPMASERCYLFWVPGWSGRSNQASEGKIKEHTQGIACLFHPTSQ